MGTNGLQYIFGELRYHTDKALQDASDVLSAACWQEKCWAAQNTPHQFTEAPAQIS